MHIAAAATATRAAARLALSVTIVLLQEFSHEVQAQVATVETRLSVRVGELDTDLNGRIDLECKRVSDRSASTSISPMPTPSCSITRQTIHGSRANDCHD